MSTSTNEIQVEPNTLANAAPPTLLLLSVREVAQAFGTSERTIWRWAATGEIPAPMRIGRSVRWRRSTVEAFLDKRERKAKRDAAAMIPTDGA